MLYFCFKTSVSKFKKEISRFHKNNVHLDGYDFSVLIKAYPALETYLLTNAFTNKFTINFSDAKAVKALNTAILVAYYNIDYWQFSDKNLCPPIPGRVDYIHYLFDVLFAYGLQNNVSILDIGTGATCVYPLLGSAVYDWNFIGTDSNKDALKNAQKIITKNNLTHKIQLQYQPNSNHIFEGILFKDSVICATMCNPPFYKSLGAAEQANQKKNKGLGIAKNTKNFSGKQHELWCKGGEKAFIHTLAYESSKFKENCFWFTTLVSKKENAESLLPSLKKLGATEIKIIPMHQGNKITRLVAWTFLEKLAQEKWVNTHNFKIA